MDYLRASFAVLVVSALALGGATTVTLGERLDDIATVGEVRDRISVELLDASVEDDRFVATVRITNPTDVDITLRNANLRVHNDTDPQLASGPSARVDDGPATIPAGGSVEATYELPLGPSERRSVSAAREREAFLSMSVGLRYESVDFAVTSEEMNATRGGR